MWVDLAAGAALSVGCAFVWKWQDLAEGLKGEPKTFRAVFVAMLVAAATLFSKVGPNGAPPNLNVPLSGPAPTLLVGSPDEPVADIAKFAAINWTTNGVDLVLHRPESRATEAVEVTLVGSTNLVTTTWEPFTNVVFAAGETSVAVFVDSAQLDAHAVSNMCFFAFINSGDTDEDGLADWDERFNLKIDPDDPDSDGDGMPDGWELGGGLLPNSAEGADGAAGDPDEDGLSNWMEYALGTLPFDRYSFDDAVDDLEWIDWGYGMPLSDYATVQVSVGDPSGSHSERWKLVLEDAAPDGRRHVVACSESGEVVGSPLYGFTDSEVHFADGVSGWATLAYGGQPIETKVRRSVASFDWYLCGIDGQGFVPSPIGTTGPHRVYTILADPVEPWSTVPAESSI